MKRYILVKQKSIFNRLKLNNKNKPIYVAINKYGIDNFSIEAIDEVSI